MELCKMVKTLQLLVPELERARLFPRPGVIDVYCNIHPRMSATIPVLPNRR
jgi:hypothetical protein